MPKQAEVVVIYACTRTGHRCEVCSAKASTACQFKLRGRKSGQLCGKHLCGRCAKTSSANSDTILCPGHKSLEAQEQKFDPTKKRGF